jgi:cell fate regulator YaaT (PSP1 superfamily)
MKIAGIRFRDNWRIYDFDTTDVPVAVGDDVIVESDRGLGYARVVRLREADRLPEAPPSAPEQQKGREGGRKAPEAAPEETEIEIEVETPGDIAAAAAQAEGAGRAEEQPTDRPRQPKGFRKVLRKATDEDARRMEKNLDREEEAARTCRDMIAERELPMKLIRAEYSFDASRVTFYFFSESRIDFRELVKDLAHKLRSRIEMRQVGVRDVARMIGGFGPCGRELCCTAFLRNFEPVSIRMAKKQEMVLNPAKISGVCGRLLCCLSYEFPVYDEIKKDISEMKQAALQEKRDAEERKLAEQRREAEEQRQIEEKQRREDEQRRQEQKQRDRQRQQEQKARKDEKKKDEKRKEGQPEQQRPPQEQRQRDRQRGKPQPGREPQQAKQPPRPEQQPAAAAQGQPERAQPQEQGGEKGKSRRKRRFWRKKKKGGGGQDGGPPQPGGGSA